MEGETRKEIRLGRLTFSGTSRQAIRPWGDLMRFGCVWLPWHMIINVPRPSTGIERPFVCRFACVMEKIAQLHATESYLWFVDVPNYSILSRDKWRRNVVSYLEIETNKVQRDGAWRLRGKNVNVPTSVQRTFEDRSDNGRQRPPRRRTFPRLECRRPHLSDTQTPSLQQHHNNIIPWFLRKSRAGCHRIFIKRNQDCASPCWSIVRHLFVHFVHTGFDKKLSEGALRNREVAGLQGMCKFLLCANVHSHLFLRHRVLKPDTESGWIMCRLSTFHRKLRLENDFFSYWRFYTSMFQHHVSHAVQNFRRCSGEKKIRYPSAVIEDIVFRKKWAMIIGRKGFVPQWRLPSHPLIHRKPPMDFFSGNAMTADQL